MRIRFVAVLLLVFGAISLHAQANSPAPATTVAVPTLVRFSGKLPAANATVGVTFSLYKDQTGDAPLWLDTQNVTLDSNGRYTVNLGANHLGGMPAELFAAGEARWLGVQLEGQPEQPRVLLVSVPYAMKAADADTLGGLPASSYVTADQLNRSAVAPALRDPSSVPPQNSAAAAEQVTAANCNVTSDGTAAANYIGKFTTDCNIENSGIYQSALATTPGFIGIGTTAPVAPLDLEPAAQTVATGNAFGEHIIANFNPAVNATSNYYAFYGQANSSTGNTVNFTGDIVGSGFIAQHYGTGTATNVFGANYTAQNRSTGTITNAVGFYGEVGNLSSGTITNGYGLWVPVPQNSGGGVFTNFYGVYIANPTGITNSWGLYTLAAKNYVSGDLGINVTAPTQALEINGNIKLDTVGHGITYPDGSVQTSAALAGTGTVTKVNSGSGLTGGPITGTGTLSVDATKIPFLATNNTFTGSITASALNTSGAVTGSTLVSTVATGTPPLTVTSTTEVPNLNVGYLDGIAGCSGTECSGSEYARLDVPDTFGTASYLTLNAGFTGWVLSSTNTDTADTSAGVRGYDDSALGYGVYGENDATATGGMGVYGTSANGIGVEGVAGASGTNGVYGNTASTSGGAAGVYGADSGSDGNGVIGECSVGSTCAGVYGYTLVGYGVVGTGESFGGMFTATGTGVYGDTSGTGSSYGVRGITENSETGNAGVYGEAVGPSAIGASASNSPFGVWGDTNWPGGVGVRGTADIGAAGIFLNNNDSFYTLDVFNDEIEGPLANFENQSSGDSCSIDGSGDLTCTGTVMPAMAGDRIEHPLDPANKYLNLASVESPEMVSVSSGNVVLDSIGEAVVRLPAWFVAANGDFRYQLTAVGAPFAPYVAEKIANGRFKIAGGLPGKEVSWQVTGVRQDAWAKAHPLQVETEKPVQDRGRYVHPELYGAPMSQRVLRGPKVVMTEADVQHRPAPLAPQRPVFKKMLAPPPPQFRPKVQNQPSPQAPPKHLAPPVERQVQQSSLVQSEAVSR